jgi:hypothetical protein
MSEKFNPSDPKYKSVEDLPGTEQENFSDVEGGFVRREAVEAYELAVADAERSDLSAMELQELIAKAGIAGIEGEASLLAKEKKNGRYSLYDYHGSWIADADTWYSVAYGYIYDSEPHKYDFDGDQDAYLKAKEDYENKIKEIEDREKTLKPTVERFFESVRRDPDKFPLGLCLAARIEIPGPHIANNLSYNDKRYVYNVGNHEVAFKVNGNRGNDVNGTGYSPTHPEGYNLVYSSDSELVMTGRKETPMYGGFISEYARDFLWKNGRFLLRQSLQGRSADRSFLYTRSYEDMTSAQDFLTKVAGFREYGLENSGDNSVDDLIWERRKSA